MAIHHKVKCVSCDNHFRGECIVTQPEIDGNICLNYEKKKETCIKNGSSMSLTSALGSAVSVPRNLISFESGVQIDFNEIF